MNISGFEKLTLLDYPGGKVAAIVFTQGCNFKCSYCQNSGLLKFNNDNLISEDEVLSYLQKRKNMLDGIVISGGEPTLQKGLTTFIKKVKSLGLLVKLDTNGSNPDILKYLLDNKLIDYVAMDIKDDFTKYENITMCKVNYDNIKKSISLLLNSHIEYEFRTTIMKNIHSIDDIRHIAGLIGLKPKYYLQNFRDSEGVLDKSLRSFSKEELKNWQRILDTEFPNLMIRGL